jgi:hypothetical protein
VCLSCNSVQASPVRLLKKMRENLGGVGICEQIEMKWRLGLKRGGEPPNTQNMRETVWFKEKVTAVMMSMRGIGRWCYVSLVVRGF